jgi:hypothetical protein
MNTEGARLPVRGEREFATGLLFLLIGGVGLWFSRTWPIGTLAMMDSGFFPRVLSGFVLLSGMVLLARGVVLPGPALPGGAWRPLVCVIAAVVAFALVVEELGIVVSVLAVVGIGSFAGTPLRPLAFVMLWAALSIGVVAVFIWGVELPLKVWPV